jgi:WXXGXW repeat (2 copies)
VRKILLLAGATVLVSSIPAFAQNSPTLAPGSTGPVGAASMILAQALPPGPPPGVAAPAPAPAPGPTVVIAPNAPPPPEAETPPPPPSPTYVWDPGHWQWDGTQFSWDGGKYIEKPAVSASFVPGHWEQRPDGWAWVPSEWNY